MSLFDGVKGKLGFGNKSDWQDDGYNDQGGQGYDDYQDDGYDDGYDDQEYLDTYYLGEPMKVTENMQISNTDVGSGSCHILYRFSDIYNQDYWSEPIVVD